MTKLVAIFVRCQKVATIAIILQIEDKRQHSQFDDVLLRKKRLRNALYPSLNISYQAVVRHLIITQRKQNKENFEDQKTPHKKKRFKI